MIYKIIKITYRFFILQIKAHKYTYNELQKNGFHAQGVHALNEMVDDLSRL